MKTRVCILAALFMWAATGFICANETIKGNGKVVTQTISIGDYDDLSVSGQMEFVYEQSNAAPFFEITVDENILPYVEVASNGSKLQVGTKRKGNSGYNLRPTVYKIKTNSKGLKKVSKSGSGKFIVNSPLNTKSLAVSSAGSGDFIFRKEVTCDRLEMSLAGSAYMTAEQALNVEELKVSVAGSGGMKAGKMAAETLNCSLAGSGRMNIGGKAKTASYSMSGSGEVKAYDCVANDVKANVSGSGRIELHAANTLSANVSGSGTIRYKGNADVNSKKSGSGSVKKAD